MLHSPLVVFCLITLLGVCLTADITSSPVPMQFKLAIETNAHPMAKELVDRIGKGGLFQRPDFEVHLASVKGKPFQVKGSNEVFNIDPLKVAFLDFEVRNYRNRKDIKIFVDIIQGKSFKQHGDKMLIKLKYYYYDASDEVGEDVAIKYAARSKTMKPETAASEFLKDYLATVKNPFNVLSFPTKFTDFEYGDCTFSSVWDQPAVFDPIQKEWHVKVRFLVDHPADYQGKVIESTIKFAVTSILLE